MLVKEICGDVPRTRCELAEAARFIDLGRLAVSSQCGFASAAIGNPFTEADERATLRRTVELAQSIWRYRATLTRLISFC